MLPLKQKGKDILCNKKINIRGNHMTGGAAQTTNKNEKVNN